MFLELLITVLLIYGAYISVFNEKQRGYNAEEDIPLISRVICAADAQNRCMRLGRSKNQKKFKKFAKKY